MRWVRWWRRCLVYFSLCPFLQFFWAYILMGSKNGARIGIIRLPSLEYLVYYCPEEWSVKINSCEVDLSISLFRPKNWKEKIWQVRKTHFLDLKSEKYYFITENKMSNKMSSEPVMSTLCAKNHEIENAPTSYTNV